LNDPHVDQLTYRLVLREPKAAWSAPPPVEAHQPDFIVRLENALARVEMLSHAATPEGARALVEPFLRAWQMKAAFSGRRMQFEFESASVIDRNPPSEEIALAFSDHLTMSMTFASSIEEQLDVGTYPAPPQPMVLTADVETLLARHTVFVEGREPLTAWANFTLSYIEHRLAASRRDAARKFNVSFSVLNEIGRLASTVGDVRTARTIHREWENRPHTAAENEFLLVATRRLIERVAEAAAVRPDSLPQITMRDFNLDTPAA
jgi:hypothetical protein